MQKIHNKNRHPGERMKFEEQSIEMKRTLLEAAVGKVAIVAHSLESDLLFMFCVVSTTSDEEFESEHVKPRTLGKLINEIEPYEIFNQLEMDAFRKALRERNNFTHRLSERYMNSIKGGNSMYSLFKEFGTIKVSIEIASKIANKKLKEMAKQGGVDIEDVKQSAKNAINEWENT